MYIKGYEPAHYLVVLKELWRTTGLGKYANRRILARAFAARVHNESLQIITQTIIYTSSPMGD